MHLILLGVLVARSVVQDTIPDPAVALDFRDGYFRLSAARKSIELPLVSPAKKKLEALIEKGEDKIVVWDRRGLTVRAGKKSFTTRFEDYPVSPRLLSSEVIRANAVKFVVGEYKRAAAGLSGHVRLGEKLYLVPRWESRKGMAWLEAIVELDLAQDLPKPKLLGRFQGLSNGKGLLDDELRAENDQLSIVTKDGDEWGVAGLRTTDGELSYVKLGSNLIDHALKPGRVLYTEQTSYGMTVVGFADLKSGLRKDTLETRGLVSFLPLEQDTALIRFKSTTYVRSLKSGAESRLSADTGYLPTELGLLVYSPTSKPTKATIYDPLTWRAVVRWTQAVPGESRPSRGTFVRTSVPTRSRERIRR